MFNVTHLKLSNTGSSNLYEEKKVFKKTALEPVKDMV